MERETRCRLVIWTALTAWAVSILLPAFFNETTRSTIVGGTAIAASVRWILIPYWGQLWIANVPLLLAPRYLHRVADGEEGSFVMLLSFFALLPMDVPGRHWVSGNVIVARPGFFLWWVSLLIVAALFASLYLNHHRARLQ